MPREIMYVGRKPTKVDNKTPNPNRVWRGLGQVIGNISDLDAKKLEEHPDVWRDVTGWSKKDRETLIAGLQDQYQAEQRRAREGQTITIDNATEEELEKQLKRVRASRGKAANNKPELNPASLGNKAGVPIGAQGNEGDERDRPKNTDDLAADILGVVVALDKSKDFDSAGRPFLERVNEQLGYTVTQQELDDVWDAVGDGK